MPTSSALSSTPKAGTTLLPHKVYLLLHSAVGEVGENYGVLPHERGNFASHTSLVNESERNTEEIAVVALGTNASESGSQSEA